MNVEAIRSLFHYNYWAHDQVWDCIMHLSDAQFTQELDYSIGSIRNHVVHVMSVDQRWIARVQETNLPDRLDYADYPTRAAARAKWDAVRTYILNYLDTLDAAQLNRQIVYDIPHRGGIKQNAVWEILAHVVNHGTDHRAQMLAMLYRLCAPTTEQDLMFYLWR